MLVAAPRFRLGWRAILLALAAALSPHASLAQGGTTTDIITGTVTGPDSQPLAGATVQATSRETQISLERTTDARGRFTIVFADGGGRYDLLVRYIGFAPARVSVVRRGDEDRLETTVQLGLASVPLDAVTVSAQRGSRAAAPSGPGSLGQNLSPRHVLRLGWRAAGRGTLHPHHHEHLRRCARPVLRRPARGVDPARHEHPAGLVHLHHARPVPRLGHTEPLAVRAGDDAEPSRGRLWRADRAEPPVPVRRARGPLAQPGAAVPHERRPDNPRAARREPRFRGALPCPRRGDGNRGHAAGSAGRPGHQQHLCFAAPRLATLGLPQPHSAFRRPVEHARAFPFKPPRPPRHGRPALGAGRRGDGVTHVVRRWCRHQRVPRLPLGRSQGRERVPQRAGGSRCRHLSAGWRARRDRHARLRWQRLDAAARRRPRARRERRAVAAVARRHAPAEARPVCEPHSRR
ncbi:MAG: hypothetical protein DMD61_14275 [Gemmatimonadetes bacterium]|nr:MAG: hypothetical protein DMD61_14275 [Gemmatimonadota bacterium]